MSEQVVAGAVAEWYFSSKDCAPRKVTVSSAGGNKVVPGMNLIAFTVFNVEWQKGSI